MIARRIMVVVGAMVVGVAATGAADGRSTSGPATVLAAASLADVVPRIDPDVRASFAGSNQLAQQARQGLRFDVFLSASPTYTQSLYADGLVRKPVAFATNRLVLIVPAGNPAKIRAVGDLARRPKLRLVVAGPKVPIGLYTREVLKRLSLLRVLRKTVSQESDVKGIVTKVAFGEADAGFVYATDVRAVAGKVRVITFPAAAQPTVVYELAIATDPRDLDAAQGFVIALLGPDGRRQLRAAGFGIPA